MEPVVVAAAVAVVGWGTTHWLALRAQRKNFINQIRNEARTHIGEALREYQGWCSKVASRLSIPPLPHMPGSLPWTELQWLQFGRELSDLFYCDSALRWTFAIEENEVLFPQLRRPREQLLDRHHQIAEGLNAYLGGMWTAEDRREAVEGGQGLAGRIREQGALIEYLHVALQNIALGQIVGDKRPVPAPRDVTLLRLNTGDRLEFGVGKPAGRVAFAWRRLRHGRFRPVFDEDLPDQRELFRQLRQFAKGRHVPVSDWWVQGEGQRMALQILDARTGRGLWLQASTPDEIRSGFVAWVASLQPAPPK